MKFLLPLGGKSLWGEEAKYMLRSLENYKDDIDLSIYSNEPVDWVKNCEVKIVPRYYPHNKDDKKFENFFDTLNKLRIFVDENYTDGEFVYIYDDVLLLKEIDYIINYANNFIRPGDYRKMSKSRHGQTILAARAKGNFVEYNYETHLPRRFSTFFLYDMFERYPFDKLDIPYAPSTLYFNTYERDPIELAKTSNIKAGFYADPEAGNGYLPKSREELNLSITGKTWISYNDRGLLWRSGNNELLKEWIIENFPNKSRWEK